MGLSSSRMGFRHSPTPRPKRSRLLSVLVCGGGVEGASTSHSPSFQIDDDPGRLQMNSAPCHNPISSKFGKPQKESVLVSETEPVLSIPKIEQVASSGSNIEATEDSPVDNSSGSVETDNHHKGLYQSKDIISPHHISIDCRIRDIPSTSYEDQLPSPPVCANGRDNLDVTRGINSMIDGDIPQFCSVVTQTCISDSCSDGMSIENHASELTAMHDFDSGSASPISGSPINFDMQNSDTSLDTIASGLAYVVSDREDGLADESSLHLDVTSFPPNTLSNSSAENSNREARHSSRRLFWDAFSRRSSRRRRDSRTIVFASEDSDDSSGSQDRWLFDFNGGYFDNRGGAETGTATLDSRTNSLNEHHWHSSSEIWGRLQSGRRWSDRRSNICLSGLHPNGTCSCESVLMADESGAHASISRIVMLAEALFEVLDEIHRQPLSLSLPIVSLPASESVVDSLPVKNHKKTHKTGDDEEQCYICLAEYEEGDTIRILPCHHEYHMICVDKWLKEIHGVCPLCRGDLRGIDASVSNTEIPSL